jgi:hypothetical protein
MRVRRGQISIELPRVGMLWNVGCTKVQYIINMIRCREIIGDWAGGEGTRGVPGQICTMLQRTKDGAGRI